MKFKLILAMIFMLIFVFGCTGNSTLDHKETIKIGSVLSLTGFASDFGINSKQGIELAVEEINKEGGLNGKLVKVIFEDDQTNGKNAVSAVNKLIEVDKIDAIIGGTWDFSLEPIVPIAERNNLIIINPSTGNTKEDSRLSPNLFRTWPNTINAMQAYREIFKKNGIEKVVVFRNSGSWGIAQKRGIVKLATVVEDFAGVNVDSNDFRSEVSKLKSINTDAVYLAVGSNDATNIVRLMKEQDVDLPIYSSEGSLRTAIDMGALKKEDAEGAHFIELSKSTKEFSEKFEKTYGEVPGNSAENAYDAVKVLANAWQETGTTDTEKVREYLQNMNTFSEYGDILTEVPVYQINNGEYVKVN